MHATGPKKSKIFRDVNCIFFKKKRGGGGGAKLHENNIKWSTRQA